MIPQSYSFRESGVRMSHPSNLLLGERIRKMFYLQLVLQVMKFDSEWAAEALQCNLDFDLWLIDQGFSLMDIHIKVFQINGYFLLWLCFSLFNSGSFFLRPATHLWSSVEMWMLLTSEQRAWKGSVGDKGGWNFFSAIRKSRVGLTDVCVEGKKLRNFDVWCSSWGVPFWVSVIRALRV